MIIGSAVILLAGGCAMNQALAESSLRFTNTIGDEYVEYVTEDASLTANERQTRINAVNAHRAYLTDFVAAASQPNQ